MAQINTLNIDGEDYEFIDQKARTDIIALSSRVSKNASDLNTALNTENQRAINAENAISEAKVDKAAGKQLSTNDFTDEYKGMLDNPAAMTGATELLDGKQGDVPVPLKGQQDKFLRGDGEWETPHDTTYDLATQTKDGLMSHGDKEKLDNMEEETDDTVSCQTDFNGDVITQALGNGKNIKTTFNADSSISTVITKEGARTVKLKTVFNEDGSITRTRED